MSVLFQIKIQQTGFQRFILRKYITNELIAEIFFDEGNGFNEKNKLSKKYLLDQNNNNTFTLELDVDSVALYL